MSDALAEELRQAREEMEHVANALERYQPLTESLEVAVHKLVNRLHALEAENYGLSSLALRARYLEARERGDESTTPLAVLLADELVGWRKGEAPKA